MTESEFNDLVDDIMVRIEDGLDECDADLDYETAGGILTITFENNSKIIINRQTPLKQIWVATKQGGFHFDYDAENDQWLLHGLGKDDDQSEFFKALSRYCTDQANEEVILE